jgi:hypothetical protein
MDVCPAKEPDHGGAAEENKIDDNLERILTLPPVCKRRHAAAEYQAGDEHKARRWTEDEDVGSVFGLRLPGSLVVIDR